MKKRPGIRSAGIVLTAAAAVVCLLVGAFVLSMRGGTRDTIVLPEDAGSAPSEQPAVESGEPFLEVDRENVQQVLTTLARPAAYVQGLEVTSFWEHGAAEATVRIWCSGNLRRAQITAGQQTQNLLTDGETVWLWYDGDARALTPDASVTFDDLIGIPTYELLVDIPPETIDEASFVTLDEPAGLSCLYLSVTDGAYTERYWVDVNTRLLCRADTLQDGERIYRLLQTDCQTMSPGDTALADVFRLPDGTTVTDPDAS